MSGKITRALMEIDGSCRDVNFTNVDSDSIAKLFEHLGKHFNSISATDENGETVASPGNLDLSRTLFGQSHLATLRGGSTALSQAQCYAYGEEDGTVSLEFTFFPEDIRIVSEVLPFVEDLKCVLGAARYWIRYEDARWPECADSVIFASEPPLGS